MYDNILINLLEMLMVQRRKIHILHDRQYDYITMKYQFKQI